MTIHSRRWSISHHRFVVLFPALLYLACNAVNLPRLSEWFLDQDRLDYAAFFAYLLAGVCLLIALFTLLAHRWTVKPAALLLILISAPVTYFVAKYNVAVDSSMILNVLHTDRTEVRQLLSIQMLPYVIALMVLPAMLIQLADITFAPAARYLLSSLRIFSVSLLIAVICLYVQYNAIHRAGNVSNKYIVYSLVPINVISGSFSAGAKSLRPFLRSQRTEPTVVGRVASNDNLIVVLAIGESARRKNFSLYGYERRDTNPVLKTVPGLHALDGLARRGSTLYALPEILEKNGVKLPSVVSQMGIPTSCYVNFTLYDNCTSVGEVRVSNCKYADRCYDEDVLPLLEKDLAAYSSGKKFVILHLGGGSHGPVYGDRHPPDFEILRPVCKDADVANKCSIEQVYNSYDNTVLYADFVLGEVLRKLDGSGHPYVFIYLSDHGESLMEGDVMFHGMPPGVPLPPEQAQIPLLVKASVPIAVTERPVYYQQDVFDSVIDLFAIEAIGFDKNGSFLRIASPQTDPS